MMRLKRNHLIVAAVIIAGAMYFGKAPARYIGGISPAGKTSALPGGYRSEAPFNPYTGN